ncbi:hypothetical protein KAS50_02000 [bacterium]|nr:hypothetical protein [bacterium]
MKCRKCEAVISDDLIRCPKCGALIPRVRAKKKEDFDKPLKYDVSLISFGENKGKIINFLSSLKKVSPRKIEKGLKELPSCILIGISSDNALKIKNKFESFGASVKIQESRGDFKGESADSFWKRNKLAFQIGAFFLGTIIIVITVILIGLNERVPSVYKSNKDISFGRKGTKRSKKGKIEYSKSDGKKSLVPYSMISQDIIDSESEALVLVSMEIDETVSDEDAVALLKKIGEEQKKRGGFKYFAHPQKVEVFLYKENDKAKSGKDGWSHKYSWSEGMFGKILSQNIKKINNYSYSQFAARRFAYHLDEQFNKSAEVNPEIKLFPSELKDMGMQVGVFDDNVKIDRKEYLAKVAENVAGILKEVDIKFEGVFVQLPDGNYYISPELCRLSDTPNQEKDFAEFLWRNIQKDGKK